MLFKKLVSVSALATLAIGQDLHLRCCQQLVVASDPTALTILNMLGIVLQDYNVLVGISCAPVTVIGGGGDPTCPPGTTLVACSDVSHDGIPIGCYPVN
ncbi:hypothetical protein E1B28_013811 [Marasmius oreades]|uniref:Hydrophobin n=1 Tax=Marasmius oreades TaxID=181124 RepID=A0A9P7UN54_9AGAR|nr:uncharacterized protein E1B28_013811 [Marasmius oreades]KAG7087873.1 hypothetical protein E1B28_013811 [Marasmius oreades]